MGEKNSWVSAEASGGTWLHLLQERNRWQILKKSSKFGRRGIQISPLKSRKLCLLKSVLAVSCSSRHCLALGLGRGESWHKLGLTRKWFALQLSVEGKQLRFSLKARLERVIIKMILLEQVHKNLSGWQKNGFSALPWAASFFEVIVAPLYDVCVTGRSILNTYVYKAASVLEETLTRWNTKFYIKMRALLPKPDLQERRISFILMGLVCIFLCNLSNFRF